MPLGNVIANHGNTLIGKMHWRSAFAEIRDIKHGTSFDPQLHGHMLTFRNNDLSAFNNVTATSLFNCWEATFYIAYTASPQLVNTPNNNIRQQVLTTGFSDLYYVPCIQDLLGYNNRQAWDQQVQAGDVVFFYADAHMALSLGGSNVLSLWSGPNNTQSLQQTTIQDLQTKVKSNAFTYYQALREAIGARGDNVWGAHIADVDAMRDALAQLQETHEVALGEDGTPTQQEELLALQAVQQFVTTYQFEQHFPNFGLEYSSQPFLNW